MNDKTRHNAIRGCAMGCVDSAMASLGEAIRYAGMDGGLFMRPKIDRAMRIKEDLCDLYHDLENDISEDCE